MAMKKRGALGWRGGTHEAYEAFLAKGGSLLRGEVG